LITNAGTPKASPLEKHKRLEEEQRQGVVDEAIREERAKRAKGHRPELLPAGATPVVSGREADGILDPSYIASLAMLEQTVLDESVEHLDVDFQELNPPIVGLRWLPKANEVQWQAILDGVYCLRCTWRHDEPHPDECGRCHLTRDHRAKILDRFEAMRELRWTPPRAERVTAGGIVLPN
jgi:hypothetical protein